MSYDHISIEKKWKDKWFASDVYKAVDFSPKPKKYLLAELPYPSGSILHMGHMFRYTAPEVKARYLRMKGYNVMFPMGWDCFGLPGETFAIKQKSTPQKVIQTAINEFKETMMSMGFSIDWSREINTNDPKFYKWTQWMFLKLYDLGLAVQQEMPVWWCKELGVLADEEVLPGENGEKISERGGYPVARIPYKQWVLKIPEYANRLINDLDQTDYDEAVKKGQINWIGRSEGMEIDWKVCDKDGNENGEKFTIYTTRYDTLPGVTFIVVAPESEELKKFTTELQKVEIEKYVKDTNSKGDLERQTNKDKTGTFTGSFAKNPFNGMIVPIYAADYVIANYGTGVVMGMPGHDERDRDFARKYDLPSIFTTLPPTGFEDPLGDKIWTEDGVQVNTGTNYDGKPNTEVARLIKEKLISENLGRTKEIFKIREQIFGRQRYWGEPIPLVYTQDGKVEKVPENELPVMLPDMEDFLPSADGTSPLERNRDWNTFTDQKTGRIMKRDTQTMPTWAGSNWYYIRYIDPKNDTEYADQEKLKYWLPVDEYYGDAGHTSAHLIYTRFWLKALFTAGVFPLSEPIKYRVSGGFLLGADRSKMSKSKPDYMVGTKDLVNSYGADAGRMYLVFLGPYTDTYPWEKDGIKGCYNTISTISSLSDRVKKDIENKDLEIKLNTLVKSTTTKYEELRINTIVSDIMTFVNVLKKCETIPENVWKDFLKIIAPITPFIAEELWQKANEYKEWTEENSIHVAAFPEYKPELVLDIVEYSVQFNGKFRGTVTATNENTQDEILEIVISDPKLNKWMDGMDIKKVIFIKGKLINIII